MFIFVILILCVSTSLSEHPLDNLPNYGTRINPMPLVPTNEQCDGFVFKRMTDKVDPRCSYAPDQYFEPSFTEKCYKPVSDDINVSVDLRCLHDLVYVDVLGTTNVGIRNAILDVSSYTRNEQTLDVAIEIFIDENFYAAKNFKDAKSIIDNILEIQRLNLSKYTLQALVFEKMYYFTADDLIALAWKIIGLYLFFKFMTPRRRRDV